MNNFIKRFIKKLYFYYYLILATLLFLHYNIILKWRESK